MAKVMESQGVQVVVLNHIAKVSGNEIRLDELSEIVTADKAVILPVKLAAELFGKHFFHLLSLQEHTLDVRDKRKRPDTRLRFQLVLNTDFLFAIGIDAYYLTANGKRLVFKVDCIPLQANDLTLTQTITGSNVNYKLQSVSLEYFKELVKLLFIIETRLVLLGFRKISLIIGIGGNNIHLDSIFERTMNIDMVLPDRTSFSSKLIQIIIELLKLKRSYIAEHKVRKFSV